MLHQLKVVELGVRCDETAEGCVETVRIWKDEGRGRGRPPTLGLLGQLLARVLGSDLIVGSLLDALVDEGFLLVLGKA